jgi:hypothetical protein
MKFKLALHTLMAFPFLALLPAMYYGIYCIMIAIGFFLTTRNIQYAGQRPILQDTTSRVSAIQ